MASLRSGGSTSAVVTACPRIGALLPRTHRAVAYAEARATFTEKQLADLTIAVGLMNAYNRLAISFRATPLAAASQPAQFPEPNI